MKTYINGLKHGLGIISIFILAGIVYAAGTWTTTSPTTITNDASLYTNSGNTLTSAKWNELVNKVKTLESTPTGGSMLVKEIIVGAGTNTATTTYVGGGSAVTSVDFTGLDGNTAGGYEMDLMLVSNTTGMALGMRINNDNTVSNYYNELLLGGGSSTYGNGASPTGYLTASNSLVSKSVANVDIFCFGNNISYISRTRYRYDNEFVGLFGTRYLNVSSNLTSLNINSYTNSSNTIINNGIGVGSTFRLYKRK
ncbi:MAG: hypothetical protein PHZ26_00070 [Candidatus Gracilibacteria bacterium]|nr:hypothetical protein [Candidatus Gracilibacteria bacterium]MDD2908132.1 hypothetical protein [Candidatus Gracilibacteria bacterium]